MAFPAFQFVDREGSATAHALVISHDEGYTPYPSRTIRISQGLVEAHPPPMGVFLTLFRENARPIIIATQTRQT